MQRIAEALNVVHSTIVKDLRWACSSGTNLLTQGWRGEAAEEILSRGGLSIVTLDMDLTSGRTQAVWR
jgi:hypothetical protein